MEPHPIFKRQELSEK
jgi:hypothetical protein